MTNYDDLPLFPLHVVLFPEMPLPLHIFEPRYREMIHRCRDEKSPFGVTLIQSGAESSDAVIPYSVGTTARIAQYEELPDGRMNILVLGEARFRVTRTRHDKPYLSASVKPFGDRAGDATRLQSSFDIVARLFRTYLKTLFAATGRSLSALQLPQEPEHLSHAIASVLQIPLPEKQTLLEITETAKRLERESEILRAEIETQKAMKAFGGALPVDTRELSKMASLN